MTLRRWTTSGRLPCFRVGGRRERRFRRADLLAFLERTGEPAPAPPAGHLCGLYTSGAARERQAAAFLAKGLEAGGTCFLAAEPTVRKRVLAGLAPAWAAAPGAARRRPARRARGAPPPARPRRHLG